jgi:hypothetical protein
MYFDGSLNIDGAGAGVLFISPTNEQLHYVLRIYFPASNNVAEYEAERIKMPKRGVNWAF